MSQDPVQEWHRLSELYRQKSDGELESLAAEAYNLTDTAQQALASVISGRRLDAKLNYQPPATEDEEIMGSVDEVDAYTLDLRSICTADNAEELATAKRALDDAGIASFIGDHYVQDLSAFREFTKSGVEIRVRYVDMRRAMHVLQSVFPPEPETDDEADAVAIPACPACQSEEIVFLMRDLKDQSKFRWRCDACGHKWIDDGVVE